MSATTTSTMISERTVMESTVRRSSSRVLNESDIERTTRARHMDGRTLRSHRGTMTAPRLPTVVGEAIRAMCGITGEMWARVSTAYAERLAECADGLERRDDDLDRLVA